MACSMLAARNPLAAAGTVAIVDATCHVFPSCCRRGGARRRCACVRRCADARSEAKAQVDFGIKVAQNGLWKEATYRWEKAVEIDPDLRGGLEQPRRSATSTQGSFDEARKAYEKARRARSEEPVIRQNYDLFKEINDRAKRRSDR